MIYKTGNEFFIDEKSVMQRKYDCIKEQDQDSEALDSLYEARLEKDRRAFELVEKYGASLDKTYTLSSAVQGIKKDSARYERYLAVKAVAQLDLQELDNELVASVAKIDLSKDYPHIRHVAASIHKAPSSLYQQIEHLQASSQVNKFTEIQNLPFKKLLMRYVDMAIEHHQLVLSRQSLMRGSDSALKDASNKVAVQLKALKEFSAEAFKNAEFRKEDEKLRRNKAAAFDNSDGIFTIRERFAKGDFTPGDLRAVLNRIKGHAREYELSQVKDRGRGGREQ